MGCGLVAQSLSAPLGLRPSIHRAVQEPPRLLSWSSGPERKWTVPEKRRGKSWKNLLAIANKEKQRKKSKENLLLSLFVKVENSESTGLLISLCALNTMSENFHQFPHILEITEIKIVHSRSVQTYCQYGVWYNLAHTTNMKFSRDGDSLERHSLKAFVSFTFLGFFGIATMFCCK